MRERERKKKTWRENGRATFGCSSQRNAKNICQLSRLPSLSLSLAPLGQTHGRGACWTQSDSPPARLFLSPPAEFVGQPE